MDAVEYFVLFILYMMTFLAANACTVYIAYCYYYKRSSPYRKEFSNRVALVLLRSFQLCILCWFLRRTLSNARTVFLLPIIICSLVLIPQLMYIMIMNKNKQDVSKILSITSMVFSALDMLHGIFFSYYNIKTLYNYPKESPPANELEINDSTTNVLLHDQHAVEHGSLADLP